MYVSPKWTLPRVAGALLEQTWLRLGPASHNSSMVRRPLWVALPHPALTSLLVARLSES